MLRLRAVLACLGAVVLMAGEVTPQGEHLAAQYDAMGVERLWLPGHPVDWQTGVWLSQRRGRTHCSAFAAAACARLGIYLLRPPEHGQDFLATAQGEWLRASGEAWHPVPSPFQAQELANQGVVVLAVYPSPDPRRSGHVALVRPSDKPDELLASEGPQVIQAGAENAASTSLRQGFRHHRGAWNSARDYRVEFYSHD